MKDLAQLRQALCLDLPEKPAPSERIRSVNEYLQLPEAMTRRLMVVGNLPHGCNAKHPMLQPGQFFIIRSFSGGEFQITHTEDHEWHRDRDGHTTRVVRIMANEVKFKNGAVLPRVEELSDLIDISYVDDGQRLHQFQPRQRRYYNHQVQNLQYVATRKAGKIWEL